MHFAVIFATVFAWSTVARLALADVVGPGSCGGGSATQEMCHQQCRLIPVPGDCSESDGGPDRCGTDPESACLPIPDTCMIELGDGGLLPDKTDAGAPILYCMEPRRCGDEVDGGCTIGTDDPRHGPSGLPAVLVMSGILFLAVDRRRRRQRDS
jgi:hypothetical protein